jgi:DNA-binding LacI/PurR family transcriptional regulator
MIRSRAVDGLIYAAGAPPSNSQLGAILGDLPLVLVDEYVPETRATSFASDNYAGGRIAAEHLASLAHQCAVVLAADGQLVSSDERVAGFRDAWVEMGFGAPTVVSGPFTEAGGREAMGRALPQINDRVSSAVFAVNDLMALGAIEVLRENDLSVPEDVSVVGFDDIPAARYAVPQLTTVRQDVDKLGRLAVAALVEILESSVSSDAPHRQRKELPVSLIVRQSTAIARTERS